MFERYHSPPANSDGAPPLDADGWLHTGDIGAWNSNGTLTIIDRRKNIFKLAQGEYVAPEKVERVYLASPFISQIFVHGDSAEAAVVAVVVPDEAYALEYARANGIAADSLTQLCSHQAFVEAVMFDMKTHAAKSGLKVRACLLQCAKIHQRIACAQGFETAQAVHLTSTEFSEENGLLTATQKVRRPLR